MPNWEQFLNFFVANPEVTAIIIILLLFIIIGYFVWNVAKTERDELFYRLLDFHIDPLRIRYNNEYGIDSRFKIYIDIEIDTRYRQIYVCSGGQRWPDHVLDLPKNPGGLLSYIKKTRQVLWLTREEFFKRDELRGLFTHEQLIRFQHLVCGCTMPIWLYQIKGENSEDKAIRGMFLFYSRTEGVVLGDEAKKRITLEMTEICEFLSLMLDFYTPRKAAYNAYAGFIKRKFILLIKMMKKK